MKHQKEQIQLSNDEVDKILEIYRPEHRYVTEAFLDSLEMSCTLQPTKYPYTIHDVFPYITAPTATIYACQLAYVLVGGLAIKVPTTVTSRGGGDWQQFLIQRDQALLRFVSFSTRFRREVENRGSIPAHIKIVRTRRFKHNVHCTMEFQIGEGMSGLIHGVITEQSR